MANTNSQVQCGRKPLYGLPAGQAGLTLIELVVVVGIISLLVAILMPSLSLARDLARQVTCLTRVHGQIRALYLYAGVNQDVIPAGTDSPHPWLGEKWSEIASNQLSQTALPIVYNAHGVLLGEEYVSPEMMFCPDDNSADWEAELQKIRSGSGESAYCSYLYRQLDGRPVGASPIALLSNLGRNAAGDTVSALVMDVNSRMPIAPIRVNHRGLKISIGFVDGSANILDQPNEEYTLRAGDESGILARLDEILQTADLLRR